MWINYQSNFIGTAASWVRAAYNADAAAPAESVQASNVK
jgi:hypothetical protein